MNVFVRYRRINDEWKDVDIRQARISLDPTATIETLINHLGSKWSINPNELLVRVYDKDFGEFIDIDSDLDNVELQNLTKYEIVHRVGKWARKEAQKSPSISTTVSDNDEPSTSYTPPSLKNEIVEIDTDEVNHNNEAVANNQIALSASSSHIDDISTRALSMFATTSGISHTRATSQPTQSTTTTTTSSLTTTGIPSMSFNVNVIEQLEKSEYGRQCLDHFEELSTTKDLFLSNAIKVKFVNIIGQWLMLNCRQCGQPSAEERRNFVAFCLAQLPCELNPDIFTNKDGTGTLDNYVKNKRQASKKRDGYLLMAAAAKRPRLEGNENDANANGTVNNENINNDSNTFNGTGNNNIANVNNNNTRASASPNESDGVGDAIHEKDICEMASMDSTRFVDKIAEKHRSTLKYRRKWIEETLKKDITIRNKIANMILTRFPQMTRINSLISIDFDHIVKKRFPNWSAKSLAHEWEETWSKKILHYALNNGNSFAVNALKDYGLEKIPSISEEDRCIFSLRLLPSLMQGKGTKVTGSDADSLITEIKRDKNEKIKSFKKGGMCQQNFILWV
uniref:Uncharacterized protein n=1 Tax=Panagrolaimus sp. ES5 TaxID=591445 RepID=A0AC34GUF3_9BILA